MFQTIPYLRHDIVIIEILQYCVGDVRYLLHTIPVDFYSDISFNFKKKTPDIYFFDKDTIKFLNTFSSENTRKKMAFLEKVVLILLLFMKVVSSLNAGDKVCFDGFIMDR